MADGDIEGKDKEKDNGIKMVPESDLIAVKNAGKTAAEKSTGDMTALRGELEVVRNNAATSAQETTDLKGQLAARADIEADLEKAKTAISEATGKAEAATNSLAARDATILAMKKANIIAGLELKADDPRQKQIEDKTDLQSLEALEEAMGLIGGNGVRAPKPGFLGSGGGGTVVPEGGYAKIKAGFAAGELAK